MHPILITNYSLELNPFCSWLTKISYIFFKTDNSAVTPSILLSSGSDEMKRLFTDHGQEINHWSFLLFVKCFCHQLKVITILQVWPKIRTQDYHEQIQLAVGAGLERGASRLQVWCSNHSAILVLVKKCIRSLNGSLPCSHC